VLALAADHHYMTHDPILLLRDALRSGDDPLILLLLRILGPDPDLRERADRELARLPRASPAPYAGALPLDELLLRLDLNGHS
jgi:hypothetical protein